MVLGHRPGPHLPGLPSYQNENKAVVCCTRMLQRVLSKLRGMPQLGGQGASLPRIFLREACLDRSGGSTKSRWGLATLRRTPT